MKVKDLRLLLSKLDSKYDNLPIDVHTKWENELGCVTLSETKSVIKAYIEYETFEGKDNEEIELKVNKAESGK